MKKVVAALLILTLIGSGCSLFKKDPQKAVNKGVSRFADVKELSSRLVLRGTIVAPSGEVPSTVQFSLQAEGSSDVSDSADPLLDMTFTISVSFDDKSGSGKALLRTFNKKFYFNIQEVSIAGETGDALSQQLASVLNTWWLTQASASSPFGKYAKQQEELKEKLKTLQFFTNAQELGEEEIEGIETTKYRVELNKDSVKTLILDFARLSGAAVSPEEELAIADSLQDIAFSGAVWIGEDNALHRIAGTITVQPTQGANSSFDVDYTAWNYGEDVEVVAPEGAREFNPLLLVPVIGAFSSLNQEQPAPPATAAPPDGAPIDSPLGSAQVPSGGN